MPQRARRLKFRRPMAEAAGRFMAVALGLVVIGVVASAFEYRELAELDGGFAPWMHERANRTLTTLMQAASIVGMTSSVLALAALTIAGIVIRGHPWRCATF